MRVSPTRRRHALRQVLRSDPNVIAGEHLDCRLIETEVQGMVLTTARFSANAEHKRHDVPLTGLEAFPNIRRELAKSYAVAAVAKPRPITRRGLWARGQILLRFLADRDPNVEPGALNGDVLARFVNWLNDGKDDGRTLSVVTRNGYFYGVMDLLRDGIDEGYIGDHQTRSDAPANPWAGQYAAVAGQEKFATEAEMVALLRTCLREVAATMLELSPILDDLDAGRASSTDAWQAQLLRDALSQAGRAGVAIDPKFLRAACRHEGLRTAAQRVVLPMSKDLAPFFIVLIHYTAWNPATLFNLRHEDIRRIAVGEARWVTLRSFKHRAGREQTATFAGDGEVDNPDEILRFVERWTASIRKHLHSDRLWVRASRRSLHVPDSTDKLAPDQLLHTKAWQVRNGLQPLSLTQIRKGLIDLAHLRSGGDRETARSVGQQSSHDVVGRYYVSPAGRRRERGRLATAVTEMERWIVSDGRVDARVLPDTADRTAATPGFRCFDNSAGEFSEPGRPCTAYGRCPICPLASVDVRSPRSVGYLHLLLDRLNEGLLADDAISAARFHGIWAPVRQKLTTFWLPMFDPETRHAAKQLDLPTLAPLD